MNISNKCDMNLSQLDFVILDFLRQVQLLRCRKFGLSGLYSIRYVLLLNLLVVLTLGKDLPDKIMKFSCPRLHTYDIKGTDMTYGQCLELKLNLVKNFAN